jgi:hypothetical protein
VIGSVPPTPTGRTKVRPAYRNVVDGKSKVMLGAPLCTVSVTVTLVEERKLFVATT